MHAVASPAGRLLTMLLAFGAALTWTMAQAAEPAAEEEGSSPCGPIALPGHYGPYDYVTESGKLNIVHPFHFTPKVEALIGGESGYLGGDLSYTLNASPNHHRALVAAMNYALRTNSATPPHMMMSVECYFDRATRFRPEDTVVRALFGLYLGRLKRMPEAIRQLEAATHYADDNGLKQHNIGLAYFDLGLFEPALKQAHLARKLGFEGGLLEGKLKAANHWQDPAE